MSSTISLLKAVLIMYNIGRQKKIIQDVAGEGGENA
jgi:hypothetical protein